MCSRLGCPHEEKNRLFPDSPGISETKSNQLERDTLRLRLIGGINSLTLYVLLFESNTKGDITYTASSVLAQ